MNGLVHICSTWHIVGAQKTPAVRDPRTWRVGEDLGHTVGDGAWWALRAEGPDSCPWWQQTQRAASPPALAGLGRGRQAEPRPFRGPGRSC